MIATINFSLDSIEQVFKINNLKFIDWLATLGGTLFISIKVF
jgi:hypothetical protein